jgi:hypothetical protein
MSKQWNPGRKKTVDLQPEVRPSRIRRDPVRTSQSEQLSPNAWWESREWEIRLAFAGILFFALAISALVIDIGEFLSH